jgi:hypothetical protein
MSSPKQYLAVVSLLLASTLTRAEGLPAFPGAEGFGALASGGRAGEIVHVTNLDDAGPGSFRDAVSKPNRIVLFDLAGVIRIKSQIAASSDLTIAGESAPGGGVTVYGNGISFSRQHNVIVRYMRFRGSSEMPRGAKTVNIASGSNMIFDHCTISWGRWDNFGITKERGDAPESKDVTFQDCLISEAIDPQRFGCLIDIARGITLARNLWVSHQSRNPKGEGDLQYINNVVYNFGHGGYVGSHSTGGVWKQDLINNYFIAGPSTIHDGHNFLGEFTGGGEKGDLVYQSGNYVDLDRDGKLNGRLVADEDLKGVQTEKGPKSEGPQMVQAIQNPSPIPVHLLTAADAFTYVTQHAGASLSRDPIDERIVADVLSLGTKGNIIKTESEAGGINTIPPAAAPKSSANDGIPDTYKSAHALSLTDPKLATTPTAGGYTNLELYLHSLTHP